MTKEKSLALWDVACRLESMSEGKGEEERALGVREEDLPRPPVSGTALTASYVLVFGQNLPQLGRPWSCGGGEP